MTQKDYVIDAMLKNGGYATLRKLNGTVDFSTWGTKTPYASIRRIVQTNKEFFRIESGLWGLTEHKDAVLKKLSIKEDNDKSKADFTHGYMQGIITEIGNIRHYTTYVPPQDKNRAFLEKKLFDVVTLHEIYNFTYPKILNFAKTIDVIWFNERNLPNAFYEVEHTTDMKNSLNKFYELQDYRAKFYIVAAQERKRQFDSIIENSIYNGIRDYIKFVSYDTLIEQYEKESIIIDGEI